MSSYLKMDATSCKSISDILHFSQAAIENDLQIAFNLLQDKGIIVMKRTKCLKRGDFLAIVRKWKIKDSAPATGVSTTMLSPLDHRKRDQTESHIHSQASHTSGHEKHNIMKIINEMTFKSLNPFEVSTVAVTADHDLSLKLVRKHIYVAAISQVLHARHHYGQYPSASGTKSAKRVCINVDCLFGNGYPPTFSVGHLRSLLLSEHLAAILIANGYSVDYITHPIEHHWKKAMCDCGVPSEKYESEPDENSEEQMRTEQNNVCGMLQGSNYLEHVTEEKDSTVTVNQDEIKFKKQKYKTMPTVINLRKFLAENALDHLYSKNIKLAEFSENSVRLKKLAFMKHHLLNADKSYDYLIHIVPQENSYCLQTVDIGMKIIDKVNKSCLNQIHIVHGPVLCQDRQENVIKVDDLLSHRKQEMRRASAIKYGDRVEGQEWGHTIDTLTKARIKFELLSTTFRQQVKIAPSKTSVTEPNMDKHGGVFVMYNYARLSNLFRNFERAVHKGIYQPLPDIDILDFTLLQEEEEWELLFNYVLVYPSLVYGCTEIMRNNTKKAEFHTHKVCQFLQDLSRVLSSYYSRFHVLGEAQDHLLPLMYCRIYLLQSIHQVMHNALSLLSIDPLSQL